jgi:hypothetical protein
MKTIAKYALALALICGPACGASAQSAATPDEQPANAAVVQVYTAAASRATAKYQDAVKEANKAFGPVANSLYSTLEESTKDLREQYTKSHDALHATRNAALKQANAIY